MCCGRFSQLAVRFLPRAHSTQASLTLCARVYATALAGGYLAAVPVVVLSQCWAAAKAADGVVRAVESAQHLQAEVVVGDVVRAAA